MAGRTPRSGQDRIPAAVSSASWLYVLVADVSPCLCSVDGWRCALSTTAHLRPLCSAERAASSRAHRFSARIAIQQATVDSGQQRLSAVGPMCHRAVHASRVLVGCVGCGPSPARSRSQHGAPVPRAPHAIHPDSRTRAGAIYMNKCRCGDAQKPKAKPKARPSQWRIKEV